MRNTILKDAPVQVDFQPQAAGPFADIPIAQSKAGQMQLDVIGGQHGDFPAFQQAGVLDDVTPLLNKLASRAFPDAYVKLGKLGTDNTSMNLPTGLAVAPTGDVWVADSLNNRVLKFAPVR